MFHNFYTNVPLYQNDFCLYENVGSLFKRVSLQVQNGKILVYYKNILTQKNHKTESKHFLSDRALR